MSRYLLRLDDASDYSDREKWQRMENLLDRYGIRPIVGIIPDNQDPEMVENYPRDEAFWKTVARWQQKGWTLALHGCTHEYITEDGGLNPVNHRSEFAGVPLEEQCAKIRRGVAVLREHGIQPALFFAPSHTFDANTLEALRRESEIRVISDTVANDVYEQDGFYFIPQQSGRVRRLPFALVTFCYHPNMMTDGDFAELEQFLVQNKARFAVYNKSLLKKRALNPLDRLLRWAYYERRK